jgi:hypothetical protein
MITVIILSLSPSPRVASTENIGISDMILVTTLVHSKLDTRVTFRAASSEKIGSTSRNLHVLGIETGKHGKYSSCL